LYSAQNYISGEAAEPVRLLVNSALALKKQWKKRVQGENQQ
jgi:hypothetical protein